MYVAISSFWGFVVPHTVRIRCPYRGSRLLHKKHLFQGVAPLCRVKVDDGRSQKCLGIESLLEGLRGVHSTVFGSGRFLCQGGIDVCMGI